MVTLAGGHFVIFVALRLHLIYMATKECGGQGQLREHGLFRLEYMSTTPKGDRKERTREFTEYSKAEAFYESIDDSASLWDVTRGAELCATKSRVAYYAVEVRTTRSPISRATVHLEASDEAGAERLTAHQLRRRGWKLVEGSAKEIAEVEYNALQPESKFAVFLAGLG